MLEVKNLSKTYKPKKGIPVKALDNINLKFSEKGMVFLTGRSGSGKSTLLNLLGGLDVCDPSGELIIKGLSSNRFKKQDYDSYRNTYIGFVFQEYNLLDDFTVGANIGLALELQGEKNTNERINEALKAVGLEGYADRKTNELSGGQKQRVAIARGLIKDPEVIMADEPTGALDFETGRQILDILKKLSEDKLVIVVSHDKVFAENYADRIIELADGRVVCDAVRTEHKERCDIRSRTEFKLIKSRLPLRSAFKMGLSCLGHKKIRLAFTALLCVAAFSVYGITDTFACYDKINSVTDTIVDNGINHISFNKEYKIIHNDGFYWDDTGNKMGERDLLEIEERYGIKATGVYSVDFPKQMMRDFTFTQYQDGEERTVQRHIAYNWSVGGFAELSDAELGEIGYELMAGRYPKDNIPYGETQEIAVTSFVYDIFKECGFKEENGEKSVISTPEDLVGKKLKLYNRYHTIVGIYDCDFDWERYESVISDVRYMTEEEEILNSAMSREIDDIMNRGFINVFYVGKEYVSEIMNSSPVKAANQMYTFSYSDEDIIISVQPSAVALFDDIDRSKVYWCGEEKSELADNEIIIPRKDISLYFPKLEHGAKDLGAAEIAEQLSRGYSLKTDENKELTYDSYEIVGIYDNGEQEQQYSENLSESDFDAIDSQMIIVGEGTMRELSQNVYLYALGVLPDGRADIKAIVTEHYNDDRGNVHYTLQNQTIYDAERISRKLSDFSDIFIAADIGLAVFASAMMFNFISSSVAYKKQEIGILRAIGARSTDVFRVFVIESLLMATASIILASLSSGIIAFSLNNMLRYDFRILTTILRFSARQVGLIFVISLCVSFTASFLPIIKISSIPPIDAINGK